MKVEVSAMGSKFVFRVESAFVAFRYVPHAHLRCSFHDSFEAHGDCIGTNLVDGFMGHASETPNRAKRIKPSNRHRHVEQWSHIIWAPFVAAIIWPIELGRATIMLTVYLRPAIFSLCVSVIISRF